jgi:hypothetical protein
MEEMESWAMHEDTKTPRHEGEKREGRERWDREWKMPGFGPGLFFSTHLPFVSSCLCAFVILFLVYLIWNG